MIFFHKITLLLFFLFLCIQLTHSSEVKTLTIILLTAPKKRPELTRTIEDLTEEMNNLPEGLVINEIVFVKGCVDECEHPELDKAIETIRKNNPSIKITLPQYNPQPTDGIRFENWFYDSLESVWPRNPDEPTDWSVDKYRKHMIINFFFLNAMKDVYKQGKCDYVLLSEDDQTYKKNVFHKVYKLMNSQNKNRVFSKIAWEKSGKFGYRKEKEFTAQCVDTTVFGAWGTLRSMEELKIFLNWVKFSRINESEDTLGYYLCKYLEGEVEVIKSSVHFGWSKRIPKKKKKVE